MKITRCTSLILALLILVSNVATAFNVHYCGTSIAGVSLTYAVQKSVSLHECCAEKAKQNKSCCKDKIVKLERKSDFTVKTFCFCIDAPFVLIESISLLPAVCVLTQSQSASYYCDAHAPPLYKLFSQYIFYA